MRDTLGISAVIVFIIAILAAFVWGMITLRVHFDRTACEAIQKTSNIESKYVGYYEGCYVKIDGRFIPQDNWRKYE